ncbi:hypothetical protein JCM13591A_21680 [Microbacterium xylanilyticum]
MTEQLTLRDLEMLQDAVLQRAGDATTERKGDRWLALERKIAQMDRDARGQICECGHLWGAHLSRTDVSMCVLRQCKAFTPDAG